MKFATWVKAQRHRDDPIGDFGLDTYWAAQEGDWRISPNVLLNSKAEVWVPLFSDRIQEVCAEAFLEYWQVVPSLPKEAEIERASFCSSDFWEWYLTTGEYPQPFTNVDALVQYTISAFDYRVRDFSAWEDDHYQEWKDYTSKYPIPSMYDASCFPHTANFELYVVQWRRAQERQKKCKAVQVKKTAARIGKYTLRFLVMQRDKYRCQLCGRTALEDGVKLEIDHRVARSKGGQDSIGNLWTLCFDCNRGKGARNL